MNDTQKLEKSIADLREALAFSDKALTEHTYYAGIAKCFEVCLEYAWKQLKRKLSDEGVDSYSPKDVVRSAGRAGLIDDVERWITCINIRNLAVHDYLGISPEEYLRNIHDFLPLVEKVLE